MNTGDIDTIDAGEVKLAKGLSVDMGLGDEYVLGDHLYVLLFPFQVILRTYESGDGFPVVFRARNI